MSARRLGALALGVVIGAAAPSAARAQAASGTTSATPAEVATSFLDALAHQRWRDAVAYVDTAAFEMLRRDELARIRELRAATERLTADALMRMNPGMSREEAQKALQQIRESSTRAGDAVGLEFAHVESTDSLERLPTAEAAARWLEANDPRFPFRRDRDTRRARGCRELPGDAELDRPRLHVVLGAVVVGDTVAYVLHQDPETQSLITRTMAMGRAHEVTPEVLALKRIAGQWRVRAGATPPDGRITLSFAGGDDCAPGKK